MLLCTPFLLANYSFCHRSGGPTPIPSSFCQTKSVGAAVRDSPLMYYFSSVGPTLSRYTEHMVEGEGTFPQIVGCFARYKFGWV